MASDCQTCTNRTHILNDTPPTPTLVEICLIILSFRSPASTSNPEAHAALNHVLNDITDSTESTSLPSSFTTWSPCSIDKKKVVILTSAGGPWSIPTSSLYSRLDAFLDSPPKIQHVCLDCSICAFACSSPYDRVPCDLIMLEAPNDKAACAIGRQFGWDPKRSALSAQMNFGSSSSFTRSGDLVGDYRAWTEFGPSDQASSSSSAGSDYECSWTSMNYADLEPPLKPNQEVDEDARTLIGPDENEALLMLFRWSSQAAGERFKSPYRKSVGRNGQQIDMQYWDQHVARPIRQIQRADAIVHHFQLDLRAVEERITPKESPSGTRERSRSGSKRLSAMATELSDRVNSLWR